MDTREEGEQDHPARQSSGRTGRAAGGDSPRDGAAGGPGCTVGKASARLGLCPDGHGGAGPPGSHGRMAPLHQEQEHRGMVETGEPGGGRGRAGRGAGEPGAQGAGRPGVRRAGQQQGQLWAQRGHLAAVGGLSPLGFPCGTISAHTPRSPTASSRPSAYTALRPPHPGPVHTTLLPLPLVHPYHPLSTTPWSCLHRLPSPSP